MKIRLRHGVLLLAMPALLAASGTAFAAACAAIAATAWNVKTTWGTAANGCVGATDGVTAGIPGSADTVSIGVTGTPRAVTVPAGYTARAASVAIGGTGTNGVSSLTLSAATSTLIVGGALSVAAPANNNTNAFNVNAGSATVNGNVSLTEGSNNSRIARIAITTGTLDINGNLTMTNANNDARTVIDMSGGAGNLFLSGNFNLSAGLGTLTPGATSTFTYDTATAAAVATGPVIQYRNLIINKAGGTATTYNALAAPRTLTVLGNLNVQAGTLDITGVNVAVTGTTSVAGTLNLSSATVTTKTFTGAVTVTGTWNNSGNTAVSMGNNLTNDGTFTSGTGTYTFTGTANWAGSNALTFSGSVVANTNTRTNAMTNVPTTIVGGLSGNGAVTNGANQTLKIGGNASITTFTASASPNTVEYNGTTSPQTAKGAAYHHLIVSSTQVVTLSGANTSIAGDLTTNGNFTPLTGNPTVTFNGTAAQSVLGTATDTTFYNLTINNTAAAASRKLTTNGDITVNNILLFTSGRIVPSGTFKVVIPASGLISGAAGIPDNRFVAGRLQKFVPNGNPSVTFEVGTDGATEPTLGYSPVATLMTNVAGSGGSFIIYATIGDHPNILTSTLDDTKSVNRWWAMTVTGVTGTPLGVFTSFDATFTFVNVNPSPTDVDSGANTGVFEIERWDGAWNVMVVGTRTGTTTQVLPVTVLGEFAVAEKKAGGSPAGGFNAMDTPTCATTGFIKTKVAGIATSLNIVALNAAKTGLQTNYNNTLRVELMNAADATGFPDVNGCGTNWTVIQQLPDVSFSGADNGCKATASFTENNVYRNVRVRMTENFGQKNQKIACSGDNFAIRPANLTVTAHDATWQTAGTARALANTGASGGIVHKASTSAAGTPRPFTLRAAPAPVSATNYDGSPTNVSGFPACGGGTLCTNPGTLTYTGGSWTAAGSGVRENATANYSEAGTFNLQLEDTTFAAVDAFDGTPDTCANTSPFGKRACSAASAVIGRFVPDYFDVAPGNSPQFQTFGAACAGARSFTYIGQSFGYVTPPVAVATARNAGGGTATNYSGTLGLWKITTGAPSDVTQTYSNNAVGPSLDVTLAANAPTVTSLNDGTGTVTTSSLDRLFYTRSTVAPVALFNANISLTVSVRDDSEADGQITTGTATPFNAIGFDSGNEFRYGRLRLLSARGSQLVSLPAPMETQYWNGTSFITNAGDNCTTIAAANIALGNYQQNLNACETSVTVGAFSSGRSTVRLSAPGSGNNGSVDMTVNLGASGSGSTCIAAAVTPVTGANRTYLQGNWTGAAYDQNPDARARFGVYRGSDEIIDFRENFQ